MTVSMECSNTNTVWITRGLVTPHSRNQGAVSLYKTTRIVLMSTALSSSKIQ